MKTILWTLAVILGICTCGLAFIPIVMVVLLLKSHPDDEKPVKPEPAKTDNPSLFDLIAGEFSLPKGQ